MKRLLAIALVFACLIGCSDDDPTGPGAAQPAFVLEPQYVVYDPNNLPIPYQTSATLLALVFNDEVSEQEIEAFLVAQDLELIGESSKFRMKVVQSQNTFAQAPALARSRTIEYVGPVFGPISCGWAAPTNQIILRGNRTHPEVLAILEAANATLISERAEDPDRAVYEVAWLDPSDFYALCADLGLHPAVEYAQPNHLMKVCF